MAGARTLVDLETKLLRKMARTSIRYGVLEPGDRILVAVSGGKDSYGLLHLLHRLRGRLPFGVEIIACHVAQGQPGVDSAPLVDWLRSFGAPFEVVTQNTSEVVKRNTRPQQTACAVCSRLRRGILYTTARRLSCNKVALGHHLEDTLATLLINLFYAGKVQAMPPKYTTNEGDLEVIRPMIEIPEGDLRALAGELRFPIVPCCLCSNQEAHRRSFVSRLLRDLEREHPDIKDVMLGALKNIRPTHLFDPTVAKRGSEGEG